MSVTSINSVEKERLYEELDEKEYYSIGDGLPNVVIFLYLTKKNKEFDIISEETINEISREFSINGNVHSVTCRAALACYVKTNWKIDLVNDENNVVGLVEFSS